MRIISKATAKLDVKLEISALLQIIRRLPCVATTAKAIFTYVDIGQIVPIDRAGCKL